ncbi:MAG: hypothetical protein DMF98_04005 [Acidobacteria bacterium]|nr:MAG: hypothetical protein DMF98_04005 [Acidobacteriota bacterium]
MDHHELQRLARLGAHVRLGVRTHERAALLRVFPDLSNGRVPVALPRWRRRRMSAAPRRAVSRRMTRYWAVWRQKNAGTAQRGA